MDDQQILDLYWSRSEIAVSETAKKYGKYCHCIAYNILGNDQDSEECVNDTLLKAWRSIPPQRPDKLAIFLGKITRNLSLDRYRRRSADKRGGGQVSLALEELADCLPVRDPADGIIEQMVLTDILNRFLGSLPEMNRNIFLRRYWYFSSTTEIAAQYGFSESKVKMVLHRLRKQLGALLEKEGIAL